MVGNARCECGRFASDLILTAQRGQRMNARIETLLSGDDFELFRAVAQASFERHYRDELPITDVQRVVLGVWGASGLIRNRGFVDHTQNDLAEWAWAYDTLGVPDAAQAIREAAELMPTIDFDADDPREKLLDPIERRYYSADEELNIKVAAYIREQVVEAFGGLEITT